MYILIQILLKREQVLPKCNTPLLSTTHRKITTSQKLVNNLRKGETNSPHFAA